MTKNDNEIIKVGVGVMIIKDGLILLHQRKGSHGEGEWAFPGGHLEFGESIEECAKRETKEEAGIEIENIKFLFFENLVKYSGKHYAHIGVSANLKSGKPKNMEPEKGGEWGWYPIDSLPRPLFGTIEHTLIACITGRNFFDYK